MAEKYFQGRIPCLDVENLDRIAREDIYPKINSLSKRVDEALDKLDFILALEALWELISSANKYIENTKPWNLKKENKIKELENFIAILIHVIRALAQELAPFMPQTAQKISAQVKLDKIEKAAPLFPRIVEE